MHKVMQHLGVESQGCGAKSLIFPLPYSSESMDESFWKAMFALSLSLSQISKIFVISLLSRSVPVRQYDYFWKSSGKFVFTHNDVYYSSQSHIRITEYVKI